MSSFHGRKHCDVFHRKDHQAHHVHPNNPVPPSSFQQVNAAIAPPARAPRVLEGKPSYRFTCALLSRNAFGHLRAFRPLRIPPWMQKTLSFISMTVTIIESFSSRHERNCPPELKELRQKPALYRIATQPDIETHAGDWPLPSCPSALSHSHTICPTQCKPSSET